MRIHKFWRTIMHRSAPFGVDWCPQAMATPKPKTGRFSVSIPPTDHDRLARIAEANHLPLNTLVVLAIERFLREAATQKGYVLHLRDPAPAEDPDVRRQH